MMEDGTFYFYGGFIATLQCIAFSQLPALVKPTCALLLFGSTRKTNEGYKV